MTKQEFVTMMKRDCAEVDSENLGFNDFATVGEVEVFYRDIGHSLLTEIYHEYYGNGGP